MTGQRQRVHFSLFMIFMVSVGLRASQGKSQVHQKVDFCDVVKTPENYTGRLISLQARITWHGGLSVWHFDCPGSHILLALPNNVKPRPNFTLQLDDTARKFFKALDGPMGIEATFDGKFDSVFTVQDGKVVRVAKGFGNKKKAAMRLVLRRVSNLLTILYAE